MKENKKAIFSLLIICILCFVITIMLFLLNCFKFGNLPYISLIIDIMLAIFTGSILSLIICIITYRNLLKTKMEKVVFLLYQIDSKLCYILYDDEGKIDVKNAYAFCNAYDEYSEEVYSILYELSTSLFFKRKKYESVQNLLNDFLKRYLFFMKLNCYVELEKQHLQENSEVLYRYLDLLLEEDDSIYLYAQTVAKMFGGEVSSIDKYKDKTKLRQGYATEIKELLEDFKNKNGKD